jgi:hypothetical protein
MKIKSWVSFSILLLVIIVLLFAWSPWLDAKRATVWATSDFNDAWKNTSDGCGVVDAAAKEKKWFGYDVELFYECGLQPHDFKQPAKSKTLFVTGVGIVF